ncbi:MAG: GTP cyclohydrolase I, partial [Candidatus Promineifilaceae bacterium]
MKKAPKEDELVENKYSAVESYVDDGDVELESNGGQRSDEEKKAAVQAAVRTILENIGEDPDREGLRRTPLRVAQAYDELLAGYKKDPSAVVNDALFDVEYDEMIDVKDIEFISLCEHHMLHYYGKA